MKRCFFDCGSNFTSNATIHLLQALQKLFGEKITVVLDNALYFTANVMKDFVEDPRLH